MVVNKNNWQNFYEQHQNAHILQSPAWGRLKSSFGWYAETVITEDLGSQILFRRLPLGFTIAYIPKGPVGKLVSLPSHINELDQLCKKNRSVFLKIEPNFYENDPDYQQNWEMLSNFGNPGKNIQPRRTMVVSLSGDPEDWLNRMKQKTRYNIRLAGRKNVEVIQSTDLKTFQNLIETTGSRNDFGVHSIAYYRKAFNEFYPEGVRLFLANYQEKPLAAIMVFFRGDYASYFYGASSNYERNRMPTYLLQFEAMKWAAKQGCKSYDLWGIPDEDSDTLEDNFKNRSDGLWGVYRFKRGFGGDVKRTAQSIDRIYYPLLYQLYLRRIGDQHDTD